MEPHIADEEVSQRSPEVWGPKVRGAMQGTWDSFSRTNLRKPVSDLNSGTMVVLLTIHTTSPETSLLLMIAITIYSFGPSTHPLLQPRAQAHLTLSCV